MGVDRTLCKARKERGQVELLRGTRCEGDMGLGHPVEIVFEVGISVAVVVGIVVGHQRVGAPDALKPCGYAVAVGIEVLGHLLLGVDLEAAAVGLAVDLAFDARQATRVGIAAVEGLAHDALVMTIGHRLVGTHVREHLLVGQHGVVDGRL